MTPPFRSAAVLVLVLVLAGITACGQSGAPGRTGTSASQTVNFWYYQPTPEQSVRVKDLAKKFEAANPGIRLKITEIPKDDYNTKLASAISGGRAPDVGYLDQPLMARYANADQIVEVPAGTIEEADYYEGALNTNKVGGRLYGVPLQQTTVVLFYNKKYVTTPPTTWEELVTASQKVHAEHPGVAGVEVPKGDGYGAWLFPGFVASAGGSMLDEAGQRVTFTERPAQDALTLWRTLLASSPRKISGSENAFQKGLTAMKFSGPWDVLGIREQFPGLRFGTALLPRKTREASTIGGDNGVVFKGAKNADGGWKWLRFLTDATHNAEFSAITGNFPVNKRAAASVKAGTDPEFEAVLEQLESATPRPAVTEWLQINDQYLAKAIEEAVDGGRSPAEALDTAAVSARKVLGWK
ncbi:ABC transporter substrate-binding protein [Streptosporangium oxazolinicum]|uniref:ABC transporter substrate-binding protein n=1 Tax=Streptosporangium oxazolinicum TaxID=909287 RepID=A0ABP8AQR7_9ACTN